MEEKVMPHVKGYLRDFMLTVPKEIYACSGIGILGRRIKSLLFSTDASIIRNTNADAVIAVYPFTPQPIITQAVMTAADVPVFVGVGGGLTTGIRSASMAAYVEHQGAYGVVCNSKIGLDTIRAIKEAVEIPVVYTVISERMDIQPYLDAGVDILNVSGAARTPEIVAALRARYPDMAIIATGGPKDETIRKTIAAGANAITYTPPDNGVLLAEIMHAHRERFR